MASLRDKVYGRLRTLLAESLGADENEINWDTNVYEDLNADVLEFHDDVVAEIEEKFGVAIDPDEVADLVTVRDLVDYIAESI